MHDHHHTHEHGPDCGCGSGAHEHGPDCGIHAHAHEHGPDCGCGEHAHEHGPDCDCGCHGHGNSVIDDALILSRSGTVRFEKPLRADSALDALVRKIQEICEAVAVDRVILGHVKALIQCEAGQAALSITRVDAPDVTVVGAWRDDAAVSECRLSLNILSVANTGARESVEALVAGLFE